MDHYEMRKALERALQSMNISKHSVWVMLSSHQRVDKLADLISPDTYLEVAEHARALSAEFSAIERLCLAELSDLDYNDKSFETMIESHPNAFLLQLILNGEDYAPIIWKMIEPEKVDASN